MQMAQNSKVGKSTVVANVGGHTVGRGRSHCGRSHCGQ